MDFDLWTRVQSVDTVIDCLIGFIVFDKSLFNDDGRRATHSAAVAMATLIVGSTQLHFVTLIKFLLGSFLFILFGVMLHFLVLVSSWALYKQTIIRIVSSEMPQKLFNKHLFSDPFFSALRIQASLAH